MDSGRFRNGLVYFIILVAAVGLLYSFTSQTKPLEVDISTVAQQAREGKINKIIAVSDDQTVEIEYRAGVEVYLDNQRLPIGGKNGDHLPVVSYKERGSSVVETLTALGVTSEQIQQITLKAERPSELGSWLAILGSILPMLFFAGVIYFMLRQAQGSNSQALSFGKSRARMFTGDKPTITFDESYAFKLGDKRFELYHSIGETPGHLMVWLPGEKTLFPGDLYYASFPNLSTPMLEARPVKKWYESLEMMLALKPVNVVPSHTQALLGEKTALEVLTHHSTAIRTVYEQTLQADVTSQKF